MEDEERAATHASTSPHLSLIMALRDESYNLISSIDEQWKRFKSSPFDLVSDAVCMVYLKHKAHHHFGIALLHRHYRLPAGYAMVHSKPHHNQDICCAERLGLRQIYPCAYQLHNGRFAPYEYSSIQGAYPDGDFLIDLATVLQKKGLENLIGISSIPQPSELYLETMAGEFEGTIATRMLDISALSHERHVVTEWAICDEFEGSRMVPTRACTKLANGGHERTKESHEAREQWTAWAISMR